MTKSTNEEKQEVRDAYMWLLYYFVVFAALAWILLHLEQITSWMAP